MVNLGTAVSGNCASSSVTITVKSLKSQPPAGSSQCKYEVIKLSTTIDAREGRKFRSTLKYLRRSLMRTSKPFNSLAFSLALFQLTFLPSISFAAPTTSHISYTAVCGQLKKQL